MTNAGENNQLAVDSRDIKKRYSKPTLSRLGDLRGTVLGGTPGVGESGGSRRPRQPGDPLVIPFEGGQYGDQLNWDEILAP